MNTRKLMVRARRLSKQAISPVIRTRYSTLYLKAIMACARGMDLSLDSPASLHDMALMGILAPHINNPSASLQLLTDYADACMRMSARVNQAEED